MKKILYIWDKAYPWDVRAEKVCESLASAGYDVHFLARWEEGRPETETIRGVKVNRVAFQKHHLLGLAFPKNPIWKKAIVCYIKDFKPDLIIVREIILGVESGKAAKKYNIPIIMDMAENYPAAMRDWKEYNSNFLMRYFVHSYKLPDRIEAKSLGFMNGVVTVCDEQIQRLEKVYKFSSKNCVVVHNTPKSNWLQSKPSPKSDEIVFMHHGHLTAEKDVSKFLKGFLLACEHKDNLRLVLAGGGHCLDSLKQIAQKSSYSDKIDFLGKYNHKDLEKIIAASHIGVIPYQISDFNQYTIHNKIFDYFAVGRPVLVSENRPSKRIIEETHAGWVVDCESIDKIKEAILNIAESDFSDKATAASVASKKYNWENDLKTLVKFVESF